MNTDNEAEIDVSRSGRRRAIGAVVVVAILVLLASLRGIFTLYTDYLWYDDLERTSVWAGIISAQVILSVIFVSIFFVLAWVNLVIADRIAPALRPPGPEEELLIRWHDTIGRRNGLIRFAIAGFLCRCILRWVVIGVASDFGNLQRTVRPADLGLGEDEVVNSPGVVRPVFETLLQLGQTESLLATAELLQAKQRREDASQADDDDPDRGRLRLRIARLLLAATFASAIGV